MLNELLSSGLGQELIVVIISILPVVELRGALPVAMGVFHLPWYEAFLLSVVGNLIPVPFLLLFFESAARLVSRVPLGKNFVDWLLKRTWRHTGTVEKYKHFGLIVFVAIPLPFTGAWTASLIAYVLGLKFSRAFLDIAIGVIGAGVIVLGLVLMGWVGAAIAGTALLVLAVLGLWKL